MEVENCSGRVVEVIAVVGVGTCNNRVLDVMGLVTCSGNALEEVAICSSKEVKLASHIACKGFWVHKQMACFVAQLHPLSWTSHEAWLPFSHSEYQ